MGYTFDGSALPADKVDGRARKTPANQYVNNDEWNTVMAGIADLRSSFLTLVGSSASARATGINSQDVSIGIANGLSLAGQALSLAAATDSTPGAMSAADKTKLDAISGTNTGGNTGDVTLAAVGATPSANGASLAGQTLTLQPADGMHPGLMTALAQTIAGLKTFNDGISIGSQPITNHVSWLEIGDGSIPIRLPGSYFETSSTAYGFYTAGAGGFYSSVGPLILKPEQVDGASAVALIADTQVAFSTAGALLVSVRNHGTEKFAIDKDGAISVSGMTHVRANSTAGQTLTDGATATIVFGTELYDANSEYDPATGIFTATRAGYYQFSALVQMAQVSPTAGDRNFQIYVTKNGTATIVAAGSFSQDENAFTNWNASSSVATTVLLAAGDTLRVRALFNGSAGTNTVNTNASVVYFTVDRLA